MEAVLFLSEYQTNCRVVSRYGLLHRYRIFSSRSSMF